jgi:hypothetical protein
MHAQVHTLVIADTTGLMATLPPATLYSVLEAHGAKPPRFNRRLSMDYEFRQE